MPLPPPSAHTRAPRHGQHGPHHHEPRTLVPRGHEPGQQHEPRDHEPADHEPGELGEQGELGELGELGAAVTEEEAAGGDGRPQHLEQLNSAPQERVAASLRGCCGSRRWAQRLAAHRPYPDLEALLAAADEASYDLTPEELAGALAEEPAHHPLSDQPGALAAHTALRAAHAAYESRFGHTFVICLDGLSDSERLDRTLSGIRARLGNDPEEERIITADELRRLARGRLTRLFAPR